MNLIMSLDSDLFPPGLKKKAADAMARMAERRIRDRTLSGRFHPQLSRGRWSAYEPSYSKKQGRQSPVTLTRARGSSGMLAGMQGKGSFTQGEMRIAMKFATTRHERIARYHNSEGIRTNAGMKIKHFLYLSQADKRAILKEMGSIMGFKIKFN